MAWGNACGDDEATVWDAATMIAGGSITMGGKAIGMTHPFGPAVRHSPIMTHKLALSQSAKIRSPSRSPPSRLQGHGRRQLGRPGRTHPMIERAGFSS
jgi:hypothetical protein